MDQEKFEILQLCSLPNQEAAPCRIPRQYGRIAQGRFPVVRAAVPIDGVLEKVIKRDGPEIEAKFMDNFQRELNYEINFKGM